MRRVTTKLILDRLDVDTCISELWNYLIIEKDYDYFAEESLARRMRRLVVSEKVRSEKDQCDYCTDKEIIATRVCTKYVRIDISKYSVLEVEARLYEFLRNTKHEYLKYVSKSKGGTNSGGGYNYHWTKLLDLLVEMDVLLL